MKAGIILVDDEEILLISWKNLLEDAGYSVRTANTAEAALELAAKEEPDIVFADLFLPGMNGIEMCRKIKEMYPRTEVFMMTGYPDWDLNYEKEFVEAGGNPLKLSKPVRSDEIIRVVESVL